MLATLFPPPDHAVGQFIKFLTPRIRKNDEGLAAQVFREYEPKVDLVLARARASDWLLYWGNVEFWPAWRIYAAFHAKASSKITISLTWQISTTMQHVSSCHVICYKQKMWCCPHSMGLECDAQVILWFWFSTLNKCICFLVCSPDEPLSWTSSQDAAFLQLAGMCLLIECFGNY